MSPGAAGRIATGGSFRTLAPTLHTETNARVIERFLDVTIEIAAEKGGRCRVGVTRRDS